MQHFNVLLATLTNYAENRIFYQLVKMLGIKQNMLTDIINYFIQRVHKAIEDNVHTVGAAGKTDEPINDVTDRLRLTHELVSRIVKIFSVQLEKFNQQVPDDAYRYDVAIVQQFFGSLASHLRHAYVDAERDCISQQFADLLLRGQNLLLVLEHSAKRARSVDEAAALDAVRHFLAVVRQYRQRLQPLQLHQLGVDMPQVVARLGARELGPAVVQLADELAADLRRALRERVGRELAAQPQFGDCMRVLAPDLLEELRADYAADGLAQLQYDFNAAYYPVSYAVYLEAVTAQFVRLVSQRASPVELGAVQQLSAQLNGLQAHYSAVLHRATAADFRQLRQILRLLCCESAAQAQEVAPDVPEAAVRSLLRV